ncbi:hypothetical protein JOD29_000806 [Lysinibacillus composti]|uniref:Uncharacterized protein n=1 Tax=Lysinibacillus composti TaxID=720633 RepID=A0A3N9UIQ3_9BACI|nr:hypothetical protein [Lysinibacillus composti]MBM7607562.1 hypothetical protein [Lysinibacillus composti]RQW75933.1 hypothetical protein EBB45_04765 [Lysinibacillus composti]
MKNKCFADGCTNETTTEFCRECLANGGMKPLKQKSKWQSLNGKRLKVYVTDNNTVIGIDEETDAAYVLHQETPMLLRTIDIPERPTKRGWF